MFTTYSYHHVLLYFLFYLSWFIILDFPSTSSQASLPILFCFDRTTTQIVPIATQVIISVMSAFVRTNLTRFNSPPNSNTVGSRLTFSVPFSYISFYSFTLSGAPYRIFLLFLPRLPYHFNFF